MSQTSTKRPWSGQPMHSKRRKTMANCEYCNIEFDEDMNEGAMDAHREICKRKSQSSTVTICCEYCGEGLEDLSIFRRKQHVENCKRKEQSVKKEEAFFPCPFCDERKFKTKAAKTRHMKFCKGRDGKFRIENAISKLGESGIKSDGTKKNDGMKKNEISVFQKAMKSECPESVEKWLKGIGLSQYLDEFTAQGYETVEVCSELDESDFTSTGLKILKKGHQKILLRAAKELKRLLSLRQTPVKIIDMTQTPLLNKNRKNLDEINAMIVQKEIKLPAHQITPPSQVFQETPNSIFKLQKQTPTQPRKKFVLDELENEVQSFSDLVVDPPSQLDISLLNVDLFCESPLHCGDATRNDKLIQPLTSQGEQQQDEIGASNVTNQCIKKKPPRIKIFKGKKKSTKSIPMSSPQDSPSRMKENIVPCGRNKSQDVLPHVEAKTHEKLLPLFDKKSQLGMEGKSQESRMQGNSQESGMQQLGVHGKSQISMQGKSQISMQRKSQEPTMQAKSHELKRISQVNNSKRMHYQAVPSQEIQNVPHDSKGLQNNPSYSNSKNQPLDVSSDRHSTVAEYIQEFIAAVEMKYQNLCVQIKNISPDHPVPSLVEIVQNGVDNYSTVFDNYSDNISEGEITDSKDPEETFEQSSVVHSYLEQKVSPKTCDLQQESDSDIEIIATSPIQTNMHSPKTRTPENPFLKNNPFYKAGYRRTPKGAIPQYDLETPKRLTTPYQRSKSQRASQTATSSSFAALSLEELRIQGEKMGLKKLSKTKLIKMLTIVEQRSQPSQEL